MSRGQRGRRVREAKEGEKKGEGRGVEKKRILVSDLASIFFEPQKTVFLQKKIELTLWTHKHLNISNFFVRTVKS